jgi:hypothetical protein
MSTLDGYSFGAESPVPCVRPHVCGQTYIKITGQNNNKSTAASSTVRNIIMYPKCSRILDFVEHMLEVEAESHSACGKTGDYGASILGRSATRMVTAEC